MHNNNFPDVVCPEAFFFKYAMHETTTITKITLQYFLIFSNWITSSAQKCHRIDKCIIFICTSCPVYILYVVHIFFVCAMHINTEAHRGHAAFLFYCNFIQNYCNSIHNGSIFMLRSAILCCNYININIYIYILYTVYICYKYNNIWHLHSLSIDES